MEIIQRFPTRRHSSPSPYGDLVASIHESSLVLRSSIDGRILRTIKLPNNLSTRGKHLRWLPCWAKGIQDQVSSSPRLLVADEDTIHVYDTGDSDWHAEISGASSNTDRIANVEFGHTADEVLVFSDFGVKATIWFLNTGRGVEVRDPKICNSGHSFRPYSGHLAILTRPITRDVVTVLAPFTRELVHSFTLATVDAQGLKWSPDGRWLAIWDASNAGLAVYVYTADGCLFKRYTGGQNADCIGLGVRNIEWDPSGKFLVVGSYENEITLLDTKTFSPTAIFYNAVAISAPNSVVWQEQINATGERSYIHTSQPICAPTRSNETSSLIGISRLCLNRDGTLLASWSDSTPSTVWIWSLNSLIPVAILIHHSPVKSLQWHPMRPDLLLMYCVTNDAVFYLWSADWSTPRILKVPLEKPYGGLEGSWIPTRTDGKTRILFGNAQSRVICCILNEGEISESPLPVLFPVSLHKFSAAGAEDMFDEGNSMDLSPIKLSTNHVTRVIGALEGSNVFDGSWDSEEMEDTFDFKQHPAVAR